MKPMFYYRNIPVFADSRLPVYCALYLMPAIDPKHGIGMPGCVGVSPFWGVIPAVYSAWNHKEYNKICEEAGDAMVNDEDLIRIYNKIMREYPPRSIVISRKYDGKKDELGLVKHEWVHSTQTWPAKGFYDLLKKEIEAYSLGNGYKGFKLLAHSISSALAGTVYPSK